MRRIFLVALLTALSACQALSPPADIDTLEPGQVSRQKEKAFFKRNRDTLADRDAIPGTPIQKSEGRPSLHNWLNYQLHISSLTRNQVEELWRILEHLEPPKLDDYARMQWAVISLHYPPRRNLSQIQATLGELEKSEALNKDTRDYARQLSLWIAQLQRHENEIFRLRQQLGAEKTLKQELEEKIRKLTDIEETLNQRQRDREP